MSNYLDSISVDGAEIKYIRFGKGSKTFVILPGLSLQSVLPLAASVEKQYEIFCNDYTVYLFDRRENLPERYSVYDMAEDTAKAMKALGMSKVCLFGASQGGMMAMIIASRYPGLVSKLALGSTACKADEKSAPVIEEWVSLAKQGDAEGLCLSFGEKVYPKDFFEKYKKAFKVLARTVSSEDLKRFIILASGCDSFDASEEIKSIECPVLVTGDTDDAIFGEKALYDIENQMKNNPDFEKYLYSGFGHAVYDMAPDFTQRLYSFFSK